MAKRKPIRRKKTPRRVIKKTKRVAKKPYKAKPRARDKSLTYYRPLITRGEEKVIAKRTEKTFHAQTKQSKRTFSRNKLEKFFDKKVANEYRRIFKRETKSKKGWSERDKKFGRRYITQIETSAYRGKQNRINNAFSARRTRIKTKKELERHIRRFKKDFLKKMEAYLLRKAMQEITFKGVRMEVIANMPQGREAEFDAIYKMQLEEDIAKGRKRKVPYARKAKAPKSTLRARKSKN